MKLQGRYFQSKEEINIKENSNDLNQEEFISAYTQDAFTDFFEKSIKDAITYLLENKYFSTT